MATISLTVKIFGDGTPPADILEASCTVDGSGFQISRTGSGSFEGTDDVEDSGRILVEASVTAPERTRWRFSASLDPEPDDRPEKKSGIKTIPVGSIDQGGTLRI